MREATLNYADHCFSGHATMHAENLWPGQLSTVLQVLQLSNLQDLRHTLHLKAILAHEEHMAKRYPGLPFLFWFSVASLITLFHLFLFKLIYNEYCGPGAKPLFRSKV
uniref:Uncharacterized protein n=1 Tax=Micrurus carvalhoi TaxID=3147026 RepID=A0A2H6NE36_9SAUR